MNSTTGCEDGPESNPADATDCRLIIRASSASATLGSVGSCLPPPPIIDVDACSRSGRDDCGMWYVSEADMPELGGGLEEYGAGSEDSTCMPPYCSAAISWGERGRDLRLSFCRRFWNHICVGGKQGLARFSESDDIWIDWDACSMYVRRVTYLDLFLVEGNALHDIKTRRLVRFGICVIRRLENCLVFCTGCINMVSHYSTCSIEGSTCFGIHIRGSLPFALGVSL